MADQTSEPSAATLTDDEWEDTPDPRFADMLLIERPVWEQMQADLTAARHAQQQNAALVAAAKEAVGRWAGGGAVSHHHVHGLLIEGPFVLAMDALKEALAAAEQDASSAGEP